MRKYKSSGRKRDGHDAYAHPYLCSYLRPRLPGINRDFSWKVTTSTLAARNHPRDFSSTGNDLSDEQILVERSSGHALVQEALFP